MDNAVLAGISAVTTRAPLMKTSPLVLTSTVNSPPCNVVNGPRPRGRTPSLCPVLRDRVEHRSMPSGSPKEAQRGGVGIVQAVKAASRGTNTVGCVGRGQRIRQPGGNHGIISRVEAIILGSTSTMLSNVSWADTPDTIPTVRRAMTDRASINFLFY